MAKIRLTKSAVDAGQPQAQAVECRGTLAPGSLCKITPAGRKVFMLQYWTNASERRKPAAEKAQAPQVPMIKETLAMFMRYVHTEDKPVRDVAELMANRRKTITGMQRSTDATT